MFELKRLSHDGVEAALHKAEHYRLLNEPWEAESICRDVLDVDPDNRHAIITLILALTDQFEQSVRREVTEARQLLTRLENPYDRAYYEGLICERRGKSLLKQGAPGCGPIVYDWLRDAMDCYERAEKSHPPGNDDVVLRWNTCARLIMRHQNVRPAPPEPAPVMLE